MHSNSGAFDTAGPCVAESGTCAGAVEEGPDIDDGGTSGGRADRDPRRPRIA